MKEENMTLLIALAMILTFLYLLFRDKDEVAFAFSKSGSQFKVGARKLPSDNLKLR